MWRLGGTFRFQIVARFVLILTHFVLASLHVSFCGLYDKDNIYVNLFIGNKTEIDVDSVPVHMSISGGYPFAGDVKITVKPEGSLPRNIKLRIPGWCDEYALKINGENRCTPAPHRDSQVWAASPYIPATCLHPPEWRPQKAPPSVSRSGGGNTLMLCCK